MFSSSHKAVLQDGRAPKETESGEVKRVARSSRAETGLPSLPAPSCLCRLRILGRVLFTTKHLRTSQRIHVVLNQRNSSVPTLDEKLAVLLTPIPQPHAASTPGGDGAACPRHWVSKQYSWFLPLT